jgi:hypothetical protein
MELKYEGWYCIICKKRHWNQPSFDLYLGDEWLGYVCIKVKEFKIK